MDAGSIQALIAGLGFAKEAFQSALKAKVDSETQKNISEAMSKLDSAQSVIFQMRSEMFDLQEKNHNLQTQLNEAVAWETRFDGYELIQAAGGAMVYRSKIDPPHFACPKCIEERVLHLLQDGKNYTGTYSCPNCGNTYNVESPKPVSIPGVRRKRGW